MSYNSISLQRDHRISILNLYKKLLKASLQSLSSRCMCSTERVVIVESGFLTERVRYICLSADNFIKSDSY